MVEEAFCLSHNRPLNEFQNRSFAATQREPTCHLLTFEAEELPPRSGFWQVKPVEEEVSRKRSSMHLSLNQVFSALKFTATPLSNVSEKPLPLGLV